MTKLDFTINLAGIERSVFGSRWIILVVLTAAGVVAVAVITAETGAPFVVLALLQGAFLSAALVDRIRPTLASTYVLRGRAARSVRGAAHFRLAKLKGQAMSPDLIAGVGVPVEDPVPQRPPAPAPGPGPSPYPDPHPDPVPPYPADPDVPGLPDPGRTTPPVYSV